MQVKSAAGYKPASVQPKTASRHLGARYIVLGSTRRDGDARQVNVQLVNGETGQALWAETFTYTPAETGAQTIIAAARIARTLHTQVLLVESRLPLPWRPEAGHIHPRPRHHDGRACERGEPCAGQGLVRQSAGARSQAAPSRRCLGYGRVRVNYVLRGWVDQEQRKALLEEAGAAIRHALEGDFRDRVPPCTARGLPACAGQRWRGDDGIRGGNEAVPTYPLAHAELGRAKIEVGLAHEATTHIAEAIRLSPKDAYVGAWFYWAGMAEAHIAAGAAEAKVEHYRKAIRWLEQALTRTQTIATYSRG